MSHCGHTQPPGAPPADHRRRHPRPRLPDRGPKKAAAVNRAAQKELQKIERQLDKLGTKETTLHAQIAENATDFEKVAGLDAQLRELTAEKEELEMRWLELAEDA